MFEIEKNVAIPETRGARAPKYPFAAMDVGDSFYVPCVEDDTPTRVKNRLLGAATWAKRRLDGNRSFTVRIVSEGANIPEAPTGVRVWRTA